MNWIGSKRRYLKRINAVLIALSLLPFLTSCATPQIVTEHVQVPVPGSLLLPCPKSELAGQTYQDAIQLAINRGKDLDECNQRFQDIRKYVSPAP